MSSVNATRPIRFRPGRTDRSWPSIISASTTTTTPVSEFSWPKAAEYSATNRHMRTKKTVFPATFLRFMKRPRGIGI